MLGFRTDDAIGPTGARFRAFVDRYYPAASDLYISSAFRPKDSGSHHSGLSWKGSPTAALDFGALDFGYGVGKARMKAFAQWLYANFIPQMCELIHVIGPDGTTAGYYVKNGSRSGPIDVRHHWNHVHGAVSLASLIQMEKIAAVRWPTRAPGYKPPAPAAKPPVTITVPATGQPLVNGPIFGWDCSDYDQDRGLVAADIVKARAEGILFFTHKLIELSSAGGRYEHTNCVPMLKAARAAGIPFVGAYVVPRSGVDPAVLASEAVKLLNAKYPGLLAYPGFFWQVDTERWPYDNVSPALGERLAVELEKRSFGRRAVHYAPRWAYGNSVPNPARPLWASSYGKNPSTGFKQAYTAGGAAGHVGWTAYSGRIPMILQYGSRCVIGSQGTSDANAFKGSTVDFAQMIGWSTYGQTPATPGKPTPVPEIEEDDMHSVSVPTPGSPSEAPTEVAIPPVAAGSVPWGFAWLSFTAPGSSFEVTQIGQDGKDGTKTVLDMQTVGFANLPLSKAIRGLRIRRLAGGTPVWGIIEYDRRK